MILAAGRGERMRPLTDTVPKALVEVAGESLIERHLRMLHSAGVRTVVINLGWLGEKIVERLGGGERYGLQIIYSPEYDNVLETAGGIQRALPMLGEDPFWVVNCDVYTDWQPTDIDDNDGASGLLVLVPTPADKKTGDFALVDGLVRNAANPSYTFSGIARYNPDFFATMAPGRAPLAPALRQAADAGALAGRIYEGLWADTGTPQRLADLEARLRS
jgi:MurNAc alpha-1-phosphate uridylyltransferase